MDAITSGSPTYTNQHPIEEERQNVGNSCGPAGEQLAETARTASRLTSAMAEAVEEGLAAARRVAKQGGDAAEEFFDDTTKRLARHPVETGRRVRCVRHRHRSCDRVVNLAQVSPAIDKLAGTEQRVPNCD